MPLNYDVLKKLGTHEARLKALFTAQPGVNGATESDVAMRKKIEDLIASRIDDAVAANMRTAHLIAAVDLAWDSDLITKRTIPLAMYAQGRIDVDQCKRQLSELRCADQYVKRSENGQEYIDLPKFCDVTVNLLRSVITRRVAAQSSRYTNLFPFFRYDPRGTSEVDKLRGDLTSQRMDIMADQYGYRANGIESIRDMLLYPHVIAFPASPWDREVEAYDVSEEAGEEFAGAEMKIKTRVTREGVLWIQPHPSRVFYDSAHPLRSINTDTGCRWFGFWDLVRHSEILENPGYFNRGEISWGGKASDVFNHTAYLSQYYTTVTPPTEDMVSGVNDRKSQMSTTSSAEQDTSVCLTHLYWKVCPNQWGMGGYPFPVWLHLTVANSRTVIHAEIMPDTPGAVFSYNTSSQRAVNLSMGHELLHWQDQVTNLYRLLVESVMRDLFQVAILNLDALPADNPESKRVLEEFRASMRGKNFWAQTSVLEVSLIKLKDLGVDISSVFSVVRQPPNTQITEIIRAIAETFQLAEKVMAMSPQEQAQLSPRETSATEVQVVAGTTENIYQFISDAIDEGRAAQKRYCFNALMSLGTQEIYLPVVKRYRRKVAEDAGFTIEDDPNSLEDQSKPAMFSVRGTKANLAAEYIFTSRDGAERSSDIAASNTLVQLTGLLLQPAAAESITREQFCELLNTIIRKSGAEVDLVLEPPSGRGGEPLLSPPAAAGPVSSPDALMSAMPSTV